MTLSRERFVRFALEHRQLGAPVLLQVGRRVVRCDGPRLAEAARVEPCRPRFPGPPGSRVPISPGAPRAPGCGPRGHASRCGTSIRTRRSGFARSTGSTSSTRRRRPCGRIALSVANWSHGIVQQPRPSATWRPSASVRTAHRGRRSRRRHRHRRGPARASRPARWCPGRPGRPRARSRSRAAAHVRGVLRAVRDAPAAR